MEQCDGPREYGLRFRGARHRKRNGTEPLALLRVMVIFLGLSKSRIPRQAENGEGKGADDFHEGAPVRDP